MDIQKSFRILDLNENASLKEIREAYIDLARVWHPDRFSNNPRLRNKAEEKLKEINIAYAEARSFARKTPRPLPREQPVFSSEQNRGTSAKRAHRLRKATADLGVLTLETIKKVNFKRIARLVLSIDSDSSGTAPRKGHGYEGIPKVDQIARKPHSHKTFIEIYEELAKSKKEEKNGIIKPKKEI